MTKVHEEVIRGSVAELAEKYAEKTWKGEITVIVAKDEKEQKPQGDRYGTGDECDCDDSDDDDDECGGDTGSAIREDR
jgi:16S rRNA C1402 (ribose-2'-O) methylase RsmI